MSQDVRKHGQCYGRASCNIRNQLAWKTDISNIYCTMKKRRYLLFINFFPISNIWQNLDPLGNLTTNSPLLSYFVPSDNIIFTDIYFYLHEFINIYKTYLNISRLNKFWVNLYKQYLINIRDMWHVSCKLE